MNLKTTFALLVLVAAGVVLVVWGLHLPPALSPVPEVSPTPDLGTRAELAAWQADKLQSIEVRAGEQVMLLERDPDGSWSLPGKWRIRPAEVKALVDLVSNLHSRFEPLPLTGDDPKKYGLVRPGVVVKVKVDGKEHTLEFGEDQTAKDAFERPTFVRLDGKDEALRLPPGLVRQLDRPIDYYQQRRLFPGERVVREGTSPEKVEQLVPRKDMVITLTHPGKEGIDEPPAKKGNEEVSLTYDGSAWKLTRPALDRPDSKTVEALLQAVPDIWAEQFVTLDRLAVPSALAGSAGGLPGGATATAWLLVTHPAVSRRWLLVRAGLDKPERVLAVTLPGKEKPITLEIGAVSGQTMRTVLIPPPADPMGRRFPPQEQTVTEDLRFARLKNNDQVFEIRADRLKDVFVPLDTLRDAHIARFNSSDVQRIQITHKGQEIILARDKERWKLIKPIDADADKEKVNDLLSKLAGLEVRGKNVSYDLDAKETGLDKPSTIIQLTLEEEVKKEGQEKKEDKDKDKEKEKRTRTLTVQLGKIEGHNLYVRDTDSPRVSIVEPALAGLAARDVLAWRGKRLFDFAATELEKATIQRGDEKITLEQSGDRWKLTSPVSADADVSRAGQLAGSLGNLEVLEYVNDAPTPKELETLYGLAKPELTVTLNLADRTKPASVLLIGRGRGPGNGYFAKLADGTSIFAVSNQVHDQLNRDSLAWRSKRILDVPAGMIDRLTIQRGDQTITLQQSGGGWKLVAPTKADVDSVKVGLIAGAAGNLETVEFVTNSATAEQLGPQYGLDKPALSITIEPADKSKPTRTVQFGKPRSGKPGLFARLADSQTVFAVDGEVRDRFAIDPLTLLPQELWKVPAGQIAQVKTRKGADEYALVRKGPEWQITGPFDANADEGRVSSLLQAVSSPHCERWVAFEAKNLADYGLDKPILQVTLVDRDGKEQGLLLGAPQASKNGAVHGKLANGPAIFVVNQALVGSIDRGVYDYLNPVLVQVPPGDLERVQMKKGAETLILEKKGKDWQVLGTPAGAFTADPESIRQLEGLWQDLEANRLVAYGPKVDLAQYGLDKPEITLAVRANKPGDKPETVERTLLLGKTSDKDGSRYARLANSPGVAELSPRLVKELTRGYLDYVDRSVLKFDLLAGQSLRLEKGAEKVEALRRDDTWVLTKPAEEKADDRALLQLWSRLANLKARRVAAFPVADLKPFGLDMPVATVVLGLSEDQKPASYTLKIGKAADEGSGDHFAQVEGSKTVVVLPGDVVRPLLAGALFLRDRTLVKFASADVLRLVRNRRKATFAQVDGNWKLTEPIKADADQDELDEFVNTLAKLRADELIQEKPTPDDLKKYGLDRPEARWQALSGDREVLDLQIGGTEKGGGRRYARISGKDLVFLLDPRLSARALSEFRPRAVWTVPLDAAQVDAIRFGFEKNPFTLERVGGAWQVKDKPDVQVSPELVNETLATLAGLKLERYVVDKDADLQLYGLKSPELVLEATTKSGKHVLQIGSREGESQRRYANLPESGRTDVFLISGADATRLARDLAAFGKLKP